MVLSFFGHGLPLFRKRRPGQTLQQYLYDAAIRQGRVDAVVREAFGSLYRSEVRPTALDSAAATGVILNHEAKRIAEVWAATYGPDQPPPSTDADQYGRDWGDRYA